MKLPLFSIHASKIIHVHGFVYSGFAMGQSARIAIFSQNILLNSPTTKCFLDKNEHSEYLASKKITYI